MCGPYRVVIFAVGFAGAALLLPELLSIMLAVVVAILLALPLSLAANSCRARSACRASLGVLIALAAWSRASACCWR